MTQVLGERDRRLEKAPEVVEEREREEQLMSVCEGDIDVGLEREKRETRERSRSEDKGTRCSRKH